MSRFRLALAYSFVALSATVAQAQQTQTPRPYRLEAVDLKQPVIWGAECVLSDGTGLSFGGQDQESEDGRPHTKLLVDGKWQRIDAELRAANPLQAFYDPAWSLRNEVKNTLAAARRIYFLGLTADAESALLAKDVNPQLEKLSGELAKLLASLPKGGEDKYVQGQVAFATQHLKLAKEQLPTSIDRTEPTLLKQLHAAQIHCELAAEAFAAEPPPRAMNCGQRRKEETQASSTLVYDKKTNLFVLFGGDHLDYLTNDTWTFDLKERRWLQRHPKVAPPPRANHSLVASGDGTVTLTGGYTYASNTDYVGGQYLDLEDGAWTYDLTSHTWTSESGDESKLAAADSRVYRTGPFHPDYYLEGERPDAEKFEAWLKELPVNEWVATNPPHLPRLNRDWGTARVDWDRDQILRWSGGHSAHGGTDVLHYHFSTNRWELPFPVEFPLGQLYSNTSYPNGYNFNLRPWMTGHTYQNYDYDPPSKTMIKAGRPHHYYIYDPDVADWTGRGEKPEAMQYNSCFYTLTLTATPSGVVCWDKNGRVHRYDHGQEKWIELELSGDELPGAHVDSSSIAYDSKHDRVLMINTLGYGKPFAGKVYAVELKTGKVIAFTPEGADQTTKFANLDKCCYDPATDLLLLGTYLKDAGDHTPTPAYDCKANRWVTLDLGYVTGERLGNTTRAFPHSRSDGMMVDTKRNLIWATDTNSQVYVLKLDIEKADVQPLK